MTVAAATPGLVLLVTSIGFGALARDGGFHLGHAVFLSTFLYALPAQVVLVDQLARGAAVVAAAFAVTLTAIRLLPMTVNLVPYFRDDPGPYWHRILAAHFIAITAWVEGSRRVPPLPPALRLPHFIGIGAGMISATITGTVIGHLAAGSVPATLAAALLLMTPLYFFISLLVGMRTTADGVAIGLGALLGPLFFLVAPGLDLLLAGVIGGSISHLLARRRKGGGG